MSKSNLKEVALGGIVSNPVFVMVLGMCPLIATSTNITSSFAMGLATLFVLLCSNVFISLLRKLIPEQARLPACIVVAATFVTVVQLFMDKFTPDLYDQYHGFVKLIVVNCIILARAESFATKHENSTLASFIDAMSMGLGFVGAICLLGATRQFLDSVLGISIASTPAGGFLILGLIMALFNMIFYYARKAKTHKIMVSLHKEAE